MIAGSMVDEYSNSYKYSKPGHIVKHQKGVNDQKLWHHNKLCDNTQPQIHEKPADITSAGSQLSESIG